MPPGDMPLNNASIGRFIYRLKRIDIYTSNIIGPFRDPLSVLILWHSSFIININVFPISNFLPVLSLPWGYGCMFFLYRRFVGLLNWPHYAWYLCRHNKSTIRQLFCQTKWICKTYFVNKKYVGLSEVLKSFLLM